MKKGEKKKVQEVHHIHWVSLTSFLFAVSGWSIFNFWKHGVEAAALTGMAMLIISPILGFIGFVRNSKDKDPQFRRFNNYLSRIGIITSMVFWIIVLLGRLF